MQGHNSALWIVSTIEIASIFLSLAAWILFSKLKFKGILAKAVGVFAALATTIFVFIPILFADLFAGRSGEAMLATLPLTLLGAPLVFFLILYGVMKAGSPEQK